MSMLENDLPCYLTYHNITHTNYVLEKTILIAEKEKISNQDLLLLKIAALYHDSGFTIGRENHEEQSCGIVIQDLKEIAFSENEISQICGMIMATKIPQRPKNKLENILADADLEYLGTDHFNFFSQKLYEEMKYFHPDLSPKQWLDIQINFISRHYYHTDYCRKYKEPIKIANLEVIKERLFLFNIDSKEL
jgi:predicted metal-dependent HD superfamily phosphohydrolase